jgi:uncharacterized protein YjbI with pentapeptide repeats
MANEEHLIILKQGIEVWNEWREDNPKIVPDLTMANLAGTDLREANFNGAELSRSDLARTDLTGAFLVKANLFGAILNEAILNRADLNEANLYGANLNRANLNRAILNGAILNGAILNGANLNGANLTRAIFDRADIAKADFNEACINNTILVDIDLRFARGLENLRHDGPSTISIDTIYRSKGNIPDAFLRGSGIPDDMIGYIHSIAGGTQSYSCLISYSSGDQEFAERLCASLQSEGVRCWLSPEDVKTGDRRQIRTAESLRIYDKLLLIISKNSLTGNWFKKTVEAAFEQEDERMEIVLFPIQLDNSAMKCTLGWAASIKQSRHIGDFAKWKERASYQKALDRLLQDLKADGKKMADAVESR